MALTKEINLERFKMNRLVRYHLVKNLLCEQTQRRTANWLFYTDSTVFGNNSEQN